MFLFFALTLIVLPLAAVVLLRRIFEREKTERSTIIGAGTGLIMGVTASTLQDWGQTIVTRLNPEIAEPSVNLVISLVAGALAGIAFGATLTNIGNRAFSSLRQSR